MAAPVYQSIATAIDDETCAKPSGVASGDLLLAVVWTERTSASTGPTDWVLQTPPTLYVDQNAPTRDWMAEVWTKVAGGSEPSDYTWTTGAYTEIGILRITGQHASDFIDSNSNTSEEGNSAANDSSITTQVNDELVIGWAHNWDKTGFTWDSPMAEITDWSINSVAWDEVPTAGAQNYGGDWSAAMWSALTLIGIKPAAGGAVSVTPTTATLTINTFAPTVLAPRLVTPATASLTLTAFAPTVLAPRLVTPSTASLTLTTFAPTVTVPGSVTPATATLTLTTFAPTVSTPRTVTPTTATLSLTTFAPTVSAPRTVTPTTLMLTISTFAPTVTATTGGDQLVTPITATLTITTYAPNVLTIGYVVRLSAGSHTPNARLDAGTSTPVARLSAGTAAPLFRASAGTSTANVRLDAGTHTENARGS